MSLTEVLPEARTLSRNDRITLIQVLNRELEQHDDRLIEPGKSYPLWSPDQAFSAADQMLKTLSEDKGTSYECIRA